MPKSKQKEHGEKKYRTNTELDWISALTIEENKRTKTNNQSHFCHSPYMHYAKLTEINKE